MSEIKSMNETEIMTFDAPSQKSWKDWKSRMGPPVPVKINSEVWAALLEAVETTADPINNPQVFRLFMKRGDPREVVHTSKIEKARRTERGIIRWEEGGYPSTSQPLRKGGNAFIRGDIQLRLDDAWWMGREQTDLRILLAKKAEEILVSAWWARGGAGKSDSASETDGELWPVKLLIGE